MEDFSLPDSLQNLLEGKTVQEVVLRLFSHQADAATIMRLCKLTEDELANILPRSLWTGVVYTECQRCRGKGRLAHVVPWQMEAMDKI